MDLMEMILGEAMDLMMEAELELQGSYGVPTIVPTKHFKVGDYVVDLTQHDHVVVGRVAGHGVRDGKKLVTAYWVDIADNGEDPIIGNGWLKMDTLELATEDEVFAMLETILDAKEIATDTLPRLV